MSLKVAFSMTHMHLNILFCFNQIAVTLVVYVFEFSICLFSGVEKWDFVLKKKKALTVFLTWWPFQNQLTLGFIVL